MDSASDFGSEGCRFESLLGQYFLPILFLFTVTKIKAIDMTFQCNHTHIVHSVVIITFLHDKKYIVTCDTYRN